MAAVTLVVLTKNEAPRIRACLESFRPAVEEVLVVDSESTDGTAEIAADHADRILTRSWPGRVKQTRFAVEQVRTPWFFQADADEVSTPALNEAIRAAAELDRPDIDAYGVDRDERFMGRWIRCGRHRNILRLCRTHRAVMPLQRAHPRWEVPGGTGRLPAPLLHYAEQPLDELFMKWTHRGILSAGDYQEWGRTSSPLKIVWHPAATFLRLYLLKGGLLDGTPGLIFSLLRAHYCFVRMARLYELQHGRTEACG